MWDTKLFIGKFFKAMGVDFLAGYFIQDLVKSYPRTKRQASARFESFLPSTVGRTVQRVPSTHLDTQEGTSPGVLASRRGYVTGPGQWGRSGSDVYHSRPTWSLNLPLPPWLFSHVIL